MNNFNLNYAWFNHVRDILTFGNEVRPRGRETIEIPQKTLFVDMRRPVLTIPERKLGYKFMAGEAYWILSGSNRVDGIAPYSERISEFSDDGETFFGAYGPKVMDQMQYVVDKLASDPLTRQAGINIWRENPPQTKDYPCTISMFFTTRNRLLNAHVFMRSSDAWLGVPYDVFNFSMIAHYVCGKLNQATIKPGDPVFQIGDLFLTAASAHIYRENFEDCTRIMKQYKYDIPGPEIDISFLIGTKTPDYFMVEPDRLVNYLARLRDTKPGDPLRWWEAK